MDQCGAGRSFLPTIILTTMITSDTKHLFTCALPKAGTARPPGRPRSNRLPSSRLTARHGVTITLEEAAARYAPGDFAQFIQAFLWVTSFLRGPEDYALIARRFAESMQRQNVLYAEVTLSIGVMFRNNQDPAANFCRSA